MLTCARSKNIVSIKINNPFEDETNLGRALAGRYRLKDALVLDTRDGSPETFGRMAAEYLDAYIADGECVGVMSGQTISRVVWSIGRLERRGLECVPLVGGIGSGSVNWHANAIAQRLAECSGGSCYILNAPVIVQSRESRDMLVREPDIAAVLEKGAKCDAAIVGIGQIDLRSTTAQSGALSARDIERLKAEGAVASVCTSYLDRRGGCSTSSCANARSARPWGSSTAAGRSRWPSGVARWPPSERHFRAVTSTCSSPIWKPPVQP